VTLGHNATVINGCEIINDDVRHQWFVTNSDSVSRRFNAANTKAHNDAGAAV
jgi:hypothetical protein